MSPAGRVVRSGPPVQDASEPRTERPMQVNLKIEDAALLAAMKTIRADVRSAGGKAMLVGGCVRDAVLGMPLKDLDIEIYGVPPARVQSLLAARYPFELVGRAFPVLRVHGLPIDVSIPCRRSFAGAAGLAEIADPYMSLDQAASRRDFTMNAMAVEPEQREVIDPFGGLSDLEAKVLRHTSDKFSEDPLRVLRGMQFAARFELAVAPETASLCRRLSAEGVASERMYAEWRKLVLQGQRPSLGLAFLRDAGWTRHFPELEPLIGCEQEPDWHPEGDVWTHTLHCMDAFATERTGDDEEDFVVGLGVLCHDFGKPATTTREGGRICSKAHEPAGEAPTRSFIGRLTNRQDLVEAVVPLVLTHLRPQALYDAGAGDSAVRRLAKQVGRIDRLVRVARCDQMGRPPRAFDGFPAGDWLLQRARALEIESRAPQALVMGRHLLALGLEPGLRLGKILGACYEAQLDGTFTSLEEGIAYTKRLIEEGW